MLTRPLASSVQVPPHGPLPQLLRREVGKQLEFPKTNPTTLRHTPGEWGWGRSGAGVEYLANRGNTEVPPR